MIKNFLRPHLAILIFCLFLIYCFVPTNKFLGFFTLSIFIYTSLVIFLSNKLSESLLTLIVSILLTAAVFTALFTYFLPDPSSYASDQRDYNHLGQMIYAHKQYGINPRETPISTKLFGITINKGLIEPTAYRPVGYPFFIALIYFLTKPDIYQYVVAVQYTLHLLSLFIFWKISKRVLGERLSSISIVLYTMCSPLIFLSNTFLAENLSQFLLLLLICCCIKLFDKKATWLEVFLGGIAGGWLILARPIFISYVPVLIALPIYQRVKDRKLNIKTTVTVLLTLFTCFLWSLRNSQAAGVFVNVATNGGINMYLGNNPFIVNGRAVTWPGDEINKILGDTVKIGASNIKTESENDNKLRKAAFAWIIDKPVLATRLGISKIEHLLLPIEGLFDDLLHFNTPRLDKYYLVLLYQSLYFWVFLFFAVVGASNKKSNFFIIGSAPYIGVIVLNFALARYQIPLYIPMAIMGALSFDFLKNKNNFYRVFLILGVLIYVEHFVVWKETLIQPTKDYFYAAERNIDLYRNFPSDTLFLAETNYKVPEQNLILKKYSLESYMSSNLIYQNKILTIEDLEEITATHKVLTPYLDILDNLPKAYKEYFSLVFDKNYMKVPIFRLVSNASLNIKNTELVIDNGLVSDLRNQEKLVFNFTPDTNSKYTDIWALTTKEGHIRVLGKEEITLKVRPRELNGTEINVLIPNEYLITGAKIYILNKPVPYHSHYVSIFKKGNNRYTWSENDMGVRQILAIY